MLEGAPQILAPVLVELRERELYDGTEIFLVGPDHLRHLFHNDGLHYLELSYNRDGSFLEKMVAWPLLLQRIASLTEGLSPAEILLFDSDSRLSQLGLLPLTYTAATHCLSSRQDQRGNRSLSQVTQAWLAQIFPDLPPACPQLRINPTKLATCQAFAKQAAPATLKVVVNFGVGNDDNKRLPSPFEEELLITLLATENTLIILDSGRGGAEEQEAKRLMAKIAERGYNTAEVSERELAGYDPAFQHGLLRFSGKIDAMAGLIMSNNLFINYDSCGQHVTTATETPAIICFAGAPNKRFIERWQPGNHHGKTTNFIIDPKPLTPGQRAQLIKKIVDTASHYRC